MKTGNNKILRISATVGFVLITLALILINNEPATGYEISIYAALSPFVWIFLIGSIACGISIIVQQAFAQRSEGNNWWLVGLLIVMLSDFIILSLPAIRGYFTYARTDLLIHIGYTYDIILTGHIQDYNIYPITHILITEISYLANVPHVIVLNYILAFFFLLHILGIYILCKVVLYDYKKTILAVASSTVLFLSYMNFQSLPTYLSAFIIPFVLYLYFRTLEKQTIGFTILLLLLILLYQFFHPLTSLILIVSFVIMEFSKVVHKYIARDEGEAITPQTMGEISMNIPLISFIIFIMWLSAHYVFWSENIREIFHWLSKEAATTIAVSSNMNLLFEKLNLQIFKVIELSLKLLGDVLIYSIFSLIAVILIVKGVLIHKKYKNLFLFILTTLIIFIYFSLFIQMFVTILFGDYWRLIGIAMLLSPPLIGFALYDLFIKKFPNKPKNVTSYYGVIIVLCIILIPTVIGVFNTYPAPYTYQINRQVTNMEINGMKWYYEYKNSTIIDKHIRMDWPFSVALLGGSHGRTDILPHYRGTVDTKVERLSFPRGLVPNHFNYLNYTAFGNSLTEDAYMPISKYDKVFYTEMYPQLNAFTKTDFKKLNHDPTVSKLYTNSELEVYFVRATRSA